LLCGEIRYGTRTKAAAKVPARKSARVAGRKRPRRKATPFVSRRAQLWNELKVLDPATAKTLKYTQLSAEKLESMVAEAKAK